MPVIPCPSPPPQPVHGVVEFSAPEFVAAWPEFTGLTNGQMGNAFNLATLILNNGCRSFVGDANKRLSLLYMLTAHICFLVSGTNDGAGNIVPPPGVVGRIAAATEGSVSVQAEYSSQVSQSEAFFIQTKYGALYWQATSQFRTMRYLGAPLSGPNGPGYPFQPWGGGGLWED